MAMTIRAVYSGGMLRPEQPLALSEGETVEVTVVPCQPAVTPAASDNDIIRRIQSCQSYREWFEVTKSLPADDGGYDIVKALDENRRLSVGRSSQ